MQQVFDALHHGGNSACIGQFLHQEAARGHQVNNRGHIAARAVPIVKGQVYAHAARDRQKVDDRVGGPADRPDHLDRILERLLGQYLRQGLILPHHLNNPPPRHARQPRAAGIDGGPSGVAGQGNAQSLDH